MSQLVTKPKRPRKRREGLGPPREIQVAVRRKSLLDAAIAVIARSGLSGITIQAIADEAECSYGVVSYQFQSKDGIILAAFDQMVEEYESTIATFEQSGASPADRIRAIVESDFEGTVASVHHIAVWASFWAESIRSPSYRQRCSELKHRYNSRAETHIDALAKERSMVLNAERVARSLNAMIDGFWISNMITGNTDEAGQTSARNDCFAYLHAIFPADF